MNLKTQFILLVIILFGCNPRSKVTKKNNEIRVNEPLKTHVIHDILPKELKDSIMFKSNMLVSKDFQVLTSLLDYNFGLIFKDSSNELIDSLLLENNYKIIIRNGKVIGLRFFLSQLVSLHFAYIDDFKFINGSISGGILPSVEKLRKERFYMIFIYLFDDTPVLGIERMNYGDSLLAYIPNIVN